jgi:hypothetical protein
MRDVHERDDYPLAGAALPHAPLTHRAATAAPALSFVISTGWNHLLRPGVAWPRARSRGKRDLTANRIEGNWKQFQGKARQQWAKLNRR